MWKATCSVSAKKFVGLPLSVSVPISLHRGELLGHELGRVEQVDALEHLVRGVGEGLDAEVPLRVGARLDGVVEVAAVEVGVDARRRAAPPPTSGSGRRAAASSGT